MKRLIGYTAALCLLAILVGCGGVTDTGTLAYISNSKGTGFTVFKVNTDGTMTKASISPQNTPAPPMVMQFTANGKWAYFLDTAGANIFGFVRAGNGTLPTLIGGQSCVGTVVAGCGGLPTGPQASSLVISPNSSFIYVALPQTLQGALAVYSIDSATGILSQVGSNITSLGIPINQLVMSPGGNLLFGLSTVKKQIVAWSLNSTSGVPTLVGTTPVGTTPSHMILSAKGDFMYITDSTATSINNNTGTAVLTPNIYGYSVPSSGVLGALPGSPFNENPAIKIDATTGQPNVIPPSNPIAGATSNDERYLFIANQGSQNISVFKISTLQGSQGSLNEVVGVTTVVNGIQSSTSSPFDCGTGCKTPSFVAVAPTNNGLFVIDPNAGTPVGSGLIFQFKINQNTGQLRQQSPASVSAEGIPTWITIR